MFSGAGAFADGLSDRIDVGSDGVDEGGFADATLADEDGVFAAHV